MHRANTVSNKLWINPHEFDYFLQFTAKYHTITCNDENAKAALNSTSETYECQCTQGYEMDTTSRICKKIEGRLTLNS